MGWTRTDAGKSELLVMLGPLQLGSDFGWLRITWPRQMSYHHPPGTLLNVWVCRWWVRLDYGARVRYRFELGTVKMMYLCLPVSWGDGIHYISWLRRFHNLEDVRGPGILDFIPSSM